MLVLKLYRIIFGKVKIKVSGDFTERFLNICAHNGISVWGIRKKNGELTLYISVSDFKRLRKLIRFCGLRIHICKKSGLPFVINRYRYRYGIAVGAVLFFAILQFLSGFVWNIKVFGNEKLKSEDILSVCGEIGIYEGMPVSHLDALNKRLLLQTKIDGIAWAALNVEGCVLTVDITETEDTEKNDNNYPSNLVSDYDGIVKKIEVRQGTTIVSADDIVRKGDLLVSGIVELSNGTTHLVRADGDIIAEVNETYIVSVPYEQKVKYICGKSRIRRAINLFGLCLPLYLGDLQGEYLRQGKLSRFSANGCYLPCGIYEYTFSPICEKTVLLTYEQALSVAERNIEKRLAGAKLVGIVKKIEENFDGVTLKCDVIVLENITKEKILLINSTNR